MRIPLHQANGPGRLLRVIVATAVFSGFAFFSLARANDSSPGATASAHSPDADGHLLNFGPGFNVGTLTPRKAEATLGGTPALPVLQIKTDAHAFWPAVTVSAPAGTWDLSPYQFLSVDIHNTDNHDIDVYVNVNNPGADGLKNTMGQRIGTQPDQRVTLTMVIKRASKSPIKLFGMEGFPQDLYPSGALGAIDPSKVVALNFFTEANAAVTSSFEISNVRVFGHYEKPVWADMTEKEFFPFIDPYGQFKFKDWPGKVHSDADLQANRDAEAKELATTKAGPADWDKWGGWAKGPKLEATGHFHTGKVRDKWWLVDPDGNLFFSFGITCVVPGGWGTTPLDGRESWFELPTDKADPLQAYFTKMNGWGGGYYAGKTPRGYDFSRANLYRKYGPDWPKTYPDLVHDRLRAWGVNTLGNWSDYRISQKDRTPYTTTFFYQVPNLKNNKAKFPDVFDPNFLPALDRGAAQFLKGTTNDSWCIGYFVDNEMAWGGDTTLAEFALASPATQAAKKRLGAWLQDRYKTIDALNTAWGTKWASWDAFAADMAAKPATDASKKDLTAFTGLIADTYFHSVRDAIKKIAPNKLYLGCRSVGGSANVISAAVKYCDVVSYNRYCASVRDIRLPDGYDAPVMIGEFHFGAQDRGPFSSGLFAADNQDDRAKKLTAYIQSALDNPQIVGVHWFQYGDDAATGRIDGENGQIGFVDVCDTPYVETIRASRASADTMYQHRSGTP